MKHDYKFLSEKNHNNRSLFRPGKIHLLLVAAIVGGLAVSSSMMSGKADANKAAVVKQDIIKQAPVESKQVAPSRLIENIPLPVDKQVNSLLLPLPAETKQSSLQWTTVKVKPGSSLAQIFSKLKLSAADLHNIIRINKDTAKLKRVLPGQSLRFQINTQGQLEQLVYQIDAANSLHVKKAGTGFIADTASKTLDTRTAHASARIDSSLFVAGQNAGLSDNMTMQLANIFGWDIDFALDIRKGDHFTVIYEEVFMDGRKVRDGEILAAEFHNRGNTYRAIRYTNKNGHSQYYSPEGMSMRKAFLRSPVSFSRISSRFSLGRKHPILNKIRAHKGVDYAASRGTPIKATGDGRIVYKGVKGGYGRTIVIKHGTAYNTLYAHMKSYNRKSRVGKKVKQGQVIGYIGSSGLATGPHLHYEFRVNGVHRNPLTVRLPKASPLPKKYRDDFSQKANTLVSQLNLITNNTLAMLQ